MLWTAVLPQLSSARSSIPMQIRFVWRRNQPHAEAQVVEFANYLHPKIAAQILPLWNASATLTRLVLI
jgi:hypothetical protein